MVMDGAMYQMFAKTASAVSILSVTKPSGQADTQGAGLVSFGVDPKDATQITQGAGIYSTPYCIVAAATGSGGYGADYVSNCGVTSAVNEACASTPARVLDLVNAVEVAWTLPYAIPSDRTRADIVCKTEQLTGADNDAKKFSHDPLRIHQSSMIAAGFGAGNCFYRGVDVGTPGSHRFQCRNIGKLAAKAVLQLSFQFSLSNKGKSYTQGVAGTATNQIVITIAKTLSCELKINTFTSATNSAVNWYQSTWTANIDGNAETSKHGQWQSFIAVKDGFASLGQKTQNSDY